MKCCPTLNVLVCDGGTSAAAVTIRFVTCGSWSLMCSCQREEGRETHIDPFDKTMFNSVPCDYKLIIADEIYWQLILLLTLSTMSMNRCTTNTTQSQLKKALEPRLISKMLKKRFVFVCVLPVWLRVPASPPTLPFSCGADRVFRIMWVAPRRGNVTWVRWGRECFLANNWLVSRRLRRNPPSGNSTIHFLSRLW